MTKITDKKNKRIFHTFLFIFEPVDTIIVGIYPYGKGDSKMNKKLYRSNRDKMLGGVAGGLADYFDVDPTIVRVVFVISLFLGGTGILAYVLLWIIVPEAPFVFNMPKGDAGQNKTEEYENKENTENNYQQTNSNSQNNFAQVYEQQKEIQRKKRSTFFGVALIILGFIFLADTWIPHLHFSHFFPIILIAIGIGLIVKSK